MVHKIFSLRIHQGTCVRPGKLAQEPFWSRGQMIRMVIEKVEGLLKSAVHFNSMRIEMVEEQ